MWPLLGWGRHLLWPFFWKVLLINGCWNLSKSFSASIEVIIWFLSFNLLIWCIILSYLHILKNPCIPGINTTCSWCMSFLMCSWILFAKILLKIFASMFISDIGLSFSFFCAVFIWFWYQGNGGLIEWVWKFWKSFRRIGVISSLNVWHNSPLKPSGPGLLFFCQIFYHSFNSVVVIALFIISISSWFSLGRLKLSKNLTISFTLSILSLSSSY